MAEQEHCAIAAILKGPEKVAYMKEHGLRSEQVWTYAQSHKNTKKTRAQKKKERPRTLTAQGGQCALCGCGRVTLMKQTRWCTDRSDKVVCNPCNLFLTRYRKLRADGVTDADMAAFGETQTETTQKPVWRAGQWVDPTTWEPVTEPETE